MEIRNNIPDQGGLTEVRYVIAHETANPKSTMDNEIAFMESNWRSAFVSNFVGDGGREVQVHRPGRLQWGAGPRVNKYAYAQVELCEDKLDPAKFKKNYVAYVNLLRSLAKEAGLPLKLDEGRGIVTHAWVSNNLGGTDHNDPYPFLARMGISKAQFKKDVENGIIQDGWQKEGNYWFYYVNGQIFKTGGDAWKLISGKWYLFDKNGAMYANTWRKVNGKWYFLEASGATTMNQWKIINGRYYKFDGSGAMIEGWFKEGKTWYYLEPSGAMKTGWFKDQGGNWYYLSSPNGAMVTGTVPIDGKTYSFNASGVCQNP